MKEKIKRLFSARRIFFISGVLIALYLIYFAYQYFFPKTKIELALFAEGTYDCLSSENAFFIRKESIVKSESNGVLTYLTDDGDRIAKNGTIAAFYKNDKDVLKREEIAKLDSQIEKLRQLNTLANTAAVNPLSIDKQVSLELKNLLLDMNNRDFRNLSKDKDNLVYLINERQIITRQVLDFSKKIDELERRKSELKFSETDVAEYGLVISTCSKRIPAIVHAVNKKDMKSDYVVVVFKCDSLNDDIISARRDSVKIVFEVHRGIKISKSALHEKTLTKTVEDENGEHEVTKTVKGVYTISAGKLKFIEIVPLYMDSKYVICKQHPDSDELFSKETIKVYDQVVYDGRNLYDGKIVK